MKKILSLGKLTVYLALTVKSPVSIIYLVGAIPRPLYWRFYNGKAIVKEPEAGTGCATLKLIVNFPLTEF